MEMKMEMKNETIIKYLCNETNIYLYNETNI